MSISHASGAVTRGPLWRATTACNRNAAVPAVRLHTASKKPSEGFGRFGAALGDLALLVDQAPHEIFHRHPTCRAS